MKTFNVPYHLVKYLTLKEENQYRHGLAWRVYFYLTHFNHGRLEKKDIKDLVSTFKSSNQSMMKALLYLQSVGFVNIKKGWIEVVGEKQLRVITLPKIGRNFNISFNFNFDLLLNRTKFYNYLFNCIFQSSATVRGKVVTKITTEPKIENETPHPKTNSDSVMLKGGLNESSRSSVSNEFIQRQSAGYRAKMTERNAQTMVKRSNEILKDQVPTKEQFHLGFIPQGTMQKSGYTCRTALTENGFNTKEYSKIVGFRERNPAETHLRELKQLNPSLFNQCFVQEANHGGYVITWNMPKEYIFTIKTKPSFSNFDYKFNKLKD